jgi:hypothetical protein
VLLPAALVLLGAVVVYAAAAGDRVREVVVGVGALGVLLAAVAVVARQPSVLPVGLAAVGASYGTFLGLKSGALDRWTPLVAATLFVAAELGFWALEPTTARGGKLVVARRVAGLCGAALLTALVAVLVLALTSGVTGGVALEAAGVAAAVLTLATIALLATRSRQSV